MKKTYIILDAAGQMLGIAGGETSHAALRDFKEVSPKAKTAMIKTDWERTEKLQQKWLMKARVAE